MKSIEDKKEVFSVMLNICTRVITLIFFVVTLSGAIFNKCEIHYSATDVFGILLMGLFSGLSFGIFYIKKNIPAVFDSRNKFFLSHDNSHLAL